MVKDIKELEKDLGGFLGKYMETEKQTEAEGNPSIEHDFYSILENCEDLIKRVNEGRF